VKLTGLPSGATASKDTITGGPDFTELDGVQAVLPHATPSPSSQASDVFGLEQLQA
jgi:hypothetical protein